MSLTSYTESDRSRSGCLDDPEGDLGHNTVDYYISRGLYGLAKMAYDGDNVYFPGETRSDTRKSDVRNMWEAFDAARKPQNTPPAERTATELLELTLHDMQWTLPSRFRRRNPAKTVRHGRRYTLVQEHGSSSERKGRELKRSAEVRRARIEAKQAKRGAKQRMNRMTSGPALRSRIDRTTDVLTWDAALEDLTTILTYEGGIIAALEKLDFVEGPIFDDALFFDNARPQPVTNELALRPNDRVPVLV